MGCVPGKIESSFFSETSSRNDALPFGTLFHEDFVLDKKLGKGAFGSVFAAWQRDEDSRKVAVKVVDLGPKNKGGARHSYEIDPKRKRSIDKEIMILKALPESEHVVRFFGEYSEGNLAYLLLELCSFGMLPAFETIATVSENVVRLVLRDMLSGISACHGANIVHRDIKADNFLAVLGETQLGFKIKLCDFGLASMVSSPDANELTGVYGTPPFMAPEMLRADKYNSKVDTWALGVLAYAFLFGTWPYVPAEQTGPAMKAAISTGKPPAYASKAGFPEVSGTAKSWLQVMLRREPEERASTQTALDSEFLTASWDESEGVCFRKAIRAAKRVGAFDQGPNARASTQLDAELRSLNIRRTSSGFSPNRLFEQMGMTDASTESGSDSPMALRRSPTQDSGGESLALGLRRSPTQD
mmetsp:Transcript_111081/g.321014  ORF Transcript_111081/g.321014 Transcript_111081/m.321014 type:complete len:414 (+) Transcript_111081:80-1321(+)